VYVGLQDVYEQDSVRVFDLFDVCILKNKRGNVVDCICY